MGRIETEIVARARAVPVVNEIRRRRIPLRRVGHELVGACPVCGDGGKGNRSDRFAVNLRKNAWLCRRCPRGGGVVDLVMHIDGVDFHEAVARLAGGAPPAPPAPAPVAAAPAFDNEQEKVQNALRRWEEASPIGGTIAEQYLSAPKLQGGRAINLASDLLPPDLSPRVLRFHPACPFGEGTRHPCLLALYRSIVGDEPTGIMRTALTPDGRKIDRKGTGKLAGAAIKLSDDAEVTMGLTIGEGLETTLAGMMFGFTPAWALGSDGGIRTFPVLSGIEALTILAEGDRNGANQRALQECFDRWSAAGREVSRVTSEIGKDTNDALMMDLASGGPAE
jgi:hypothetical protein